jgi:hypothetical protein
MTTETPERVYPPLIPLTDQDALVAAMHRLATAVEQLVLEMHDSRLTPPVGNVPALGQQTMATPPPFQPLPAMNQQRPACPRHGLDKVKPSTKGPGFYCTAKENNGKFCDWRG